MPAIRLSSRRRRSSHAIFTPAKPGIYGARPVTFAPNVTPVTYIETDDDDLTLLSTSPLPPSYPSNSLSSSSSPTTIFPPSSTPAPPARKRCPPGKRRSQGYIPRPPNAFMLFRADFVRQKHVPGSIETNHGSLSKIIGNCWRQLPLDEKRIWEIKAKQEKANHKAQFPDYRFRPVHNKNKNKDKVSSLTTAPTAITTSNSSSSNVNNADGLTREEEERRCEQVAQLLLGGMKGEELARAVRDLDRVREEEATSSRTTIPDSSNSFDANLLAMPIPMTAFHNPFGFANFNFGGMNSNNNSGGLALPPSAYHRRSSSVPLPLHNSSDFFMAGGRSTSPQSFDVTGITLPSVPYISHSQTRPTSPINNISQQRTLLGYRRASSAQPVLRRSWALSFYPTNNTFPTGPGFGNNDFSGFDWNMTMDVNTNGQVERDDSPLPDVELEFNGFTFDEGGVDSTDSLPPNTLLSSSISSSASSASVSSRNSPWIEAPSATGQHQAHTRSLSQHCPPLAIAPHDLPPLDVSPDIDWSSSLSAATTSSTPAQTCSTTPLSAFSSPDLLSTPATASGPTASIPSNEKLDNQGMFLGLGMDFEIGLGMGVDMGGVDYTTAYGYNTMSMGYVGDMVMGYNVSATGGGNDLGMPTTTEMDMMWNGQSQAQQA